MLLPPLVGAIVYTIPLTYDFIRHTEGNNLIASLYSFFGLLVLILPATFIIMLIPSLIYTLAMEFQINLKVENDHLVIAISSSIGFLSGGTLSMFPISPIGAILFLFLGAIVGAIVGVILRINRNKEIAYKLLQTDQMPATRPFGR